MAALPIPADARSIALRPRVLTRLQDGSKVPQRFPYGLGTAPLDDAVSFRAFESWRNPSEGAYNGHWRQRAIHTRRGSDAEAPETIKTRGWHAKSPQSFFESNGGQLRRRLPSPGNSFAVDRARTSILPRAENRLEALPKVDYYPDQ